ncbi:hypothetical protein MAPG_09090 [Magnaporthiopsis poae ATCC 64411]|uniref:Uncharacterized protein n=1 Tax=Magnaporthiopsis poae (strain ATCC 64411 / 73-15) TaxID=644358 RepID=A0A0C4E914_MAGP6|nr:hypothetical protein MAPG_09090 [Magnaporthiopsis poae ATCC 64411]
MNRERPGSCPIQLMRGGSHLDAHLVYWKVMKLMWMCQHPVQQAYARSRCEELHKCREIDQASHHKAVAVIFGVFRAQTASLVELESAPKHVAALVDFAVPRATDHVELRQDKSLRDTYLPETWASGITLFSEWIQIETRKRADREGRDTGDLAGLLNFKFFDYFMRRNLDLELPGIAHSFFSSYYERLTASFAILAHDDVEGRWASRVWMDSFSDGSEYL